MSKRKERKPNLSQETLERARRQAGGEPVEETPEVVQPVPEVEEAAPAPKLAAPKGPVTAPSGPRRTQSSKERAVRRRNIGVTQVGVSRKEARDQAYVSAMLSNPTKDVTEDQLRQEYGYVLADLRSMAILAAGIMVALVIVAGVLTNLL